MHDLFVLPEINKLDYTTTNNISHPKRFNPESGRLLYRRKLPGSNKIITFRVVEIEKDLETFYHWHHQPRVSEFWELAKPIDELEQYLKNALTDPHLIPSFVELDGKPVGYFEFYWAKEDRLGPYYDSEDFDQGFHFLIGEKEALGFASTSAIINSNIHFLFMREPRTRRIMVEPRSDNNKVLRYMGKHWIKIKDFHFPHKHALLLECSRERFFNEVKL